MGCLLSGRTLRKINKKLFFSHLTYDILNMYRQIPASRKCPGHEDALSVQGMCNVDIKVNDLIVVKKNHPCGNNIFRVKRIGMDFKIVCTKCGREILITRSNIERNIKKVISDSGEQP